MADYLIHESTLEDIADAIRAKTGGSALITPEDMPTEISSISGGGTSLDYGVVFENVNASHQPTKMKVYGEYIGDLLFANGVNNSSTPWNTFVEEVELVDAETVGRAAFMTVKSGGAALTFDTFTANHVKTIGMQLVSGQQALTSISLPLVEDLFIPYGNVTYKEDSNYTGSEFYQCTSLESISLPLAKNINRNTFAQCSSLKTVYLPCCTDTIARNNNNGSFYNDTALETVQIGSVGHGITQLHQYTFYNCTQTGLVITLYTTGSYVDTAVANARNGATNATIIIKASENTTYNNVSYNAGDTILTSEVT